MALDERPGDSGRKIPSKTQGAWARMTVPVAGATDDGPVIEWAARLAELFDADLNVVFAPPDPAELSPWLGEGFMGTVQMTTIDSVRTAGEEGERRAHMQFDTLGYDRATFSVLSPPVWQDLAIEARLSDLVIFGDSSARARGLLAEAFTQVLMEERCAVFVARTAFDPAGVAIVAWDGKEPSSRAARRAVPLLKQASKVIIAGAPLGDRPAELERLGAYYQAHGIEVGYERLPKGDICAQLIEAYGRHGADYMVAGAFGRSRIREFAFGGTTRHLLQNTSLNLYMAH
jgi:nucleotide-binding universal stress UspA family protein